jgi:hypothetical protein
VNVAFFDPAPLAPGCAVLIEVESRYQKAVRVGEELENPISVGLASHQLEEFGPQQLGGTQHEHVHRRG